METKTYELSADEVNLLIQVLDRTQFTKIMTAKAVVAISEKLAAPFGGLQETPAPETPAPEATE